MLNFNNYLKMYINSKHKNTNDSINFLCTPVYHPMIGVIK